MSGKPELAIIVARARNGVIGRDNTLPWRLRDDLQLFKQRTIGHPIIMGRKTWESLGRPLPNRTHYVITRQAGYTAPGTTVVGSLEAAIAACGDSDCAFVLGGGEIYRLALAHADVLWITEVDAEIDGDTCFPDFDASQFREASRRHFDASETNQYAFDVVEYRRIT